MYTVEAPRLNLKPRFINSKCMSTNFYNWTMHFRHDADILASYGFDFRLKNETSPYPRFTKKRSANQAGLILKKKTKTAFWIASHCPTEIKRENYVKALQKYIDVDVYGDCGNLTCVGTCIDDNSLEYYFYLAFENSICPDYISEKFWRNLNQPVIPVVMGGGNYFRDAPPHSYIDVNDFSSIEDLANYLKSLMNSRAKYLEYFQWKYDYYMYQKDEW